MSAEPSTSDETAGLLRAALIHHAEARTDQAEPMYRRVLDRQPDHPQALGMLGLILADGARDREAEVVLERHLALRPQDAASLHALGRLRLRQSRDKDAAVLLARSAEHNPGLAPIHNDLGVCLHRLGRGDPALEAFDRAVALDPTYAVAHANRGLSLYDHHRFDEALQAQSIALELTPRDQAAARVDILQQLARAARKSGRPDAASTLLRREIENGGADPQLAADLAETLEQAGQSAQALIVRNALARRTGLSHGGERRASKGAILLLGAVGGGHTPTRYLVDPNAFAISTLTLLSPDQPDAPLGSVDIQALMDADLVFSTLGDVDHDGGQFAAVTSLCARLGKPLLNSPAAIAHTGRDGAAALFGGIAGMVTPDTRAIGREALSDLPIAAPTLVRPAGDHGGDNLALLRDDADKAAFLQHCPAERLLLTPFHDFRSPDGYWRKYRLIFVDRQVFPYHLAIGDDWLTHYWRADMGHSAWKMAEEERFLADWRGVFGPKATAAADAAARRLDLDYGGMDCALTAEGELLLFEANACVLLHLDEPKAQFGYKHRYVPPIREAFTRMALKRAGKP